MISVFALSSECVFIQVCSLSNVFYELFRPVFSCTDSNINHTRGSSRWDIAILLQSCSLEFSYLVVNTLCFVMDELRVGLFRNCDPIKKTGTQGSLPGNVGII